TFFNPAGANVAASTLGEYQQDMLLRSVQTRLPAANRTTDVKLAGEHFLSYALPLSTDNGNAIALLQRSLDKELAPYLRLERTFLLLALTGLLASVAVGFWIARSVSNPVLELAEGTRKISEGDYSHRLAIRTEDEMGVLASAFNRMSQGLAERDQVHDLLGKVVSPAVATE